MAPVVPEPTIERNKLATTNVASRLPQREKLLLVGLILVFVLVWWSPPLRALHGIDLMPLWLHTLMEIFAIVIAAMTFGVIWNAHTQERSGNLVILACAFLATGLIDFAHTISYRGMPVFVTPAGVEKAINFWLVARLTMASALLVVALRPWRPFISSRTPTLFLVGALALTASIWWQELFHPDTWPRTFIEGQGLTPFKITVEYVIVALMTIAALIFHARSRCESASESSRLRLPILIGILSELCFTLYSDATDLMNLLGHGYKVIAYGFFYRAVFVQCVHEPYRRLHLEIDEHQKTGLALAESVRYQKELLAHLPTAVVVHGTDTAIRYCNDEARHLLGLVGTGIHGIPASAARWKFLHDDGTPMAPEFYPVNQVLSNQQPLRGIVMGIVLDGAVDPLWFHVNAFPHLSATGEIAEVVVSFVDITARRSAVNALRQSLAELDALYNLAPCGYHSLDATGCIVRINQTELDWLGYTREELIGRPFTELCTDHTKGVFTANYPRFKTVGQIHDLEYELIRKDGSTFTVLLSASAEYDAAGRFVKTRSTLHDITARKQSEHELQRLNRLYTLLSRANQAIVRIDDLDLLLETICRIAVEDGGFVMAWAGRVEEGCITPYAHWGKEDGYLEQVRIVIADRALGAGPTGEAIRAGRHFICDDIANDPRMAPWRALALERGYRASAAFPVRTGGNVVGAINLYAPTPGFFSQAMIELLNDLTEDISFAMNAHAEAARRRRAEADIGRLNEQLEQRVLQRTRELEIANKELEAFSYSVSHDLRAPLRGIDGFSQVLLKRYADKLDDTGRDYLNRVRRASQRMGELIDDLLNLSRMTRSPLRRQDVDLSELATALLQEMQRATPDREVKITVQPNIKVFGDPGLLRVVLDNLLGNAWKFTRHTTDARIEFGCRESNDELVYFVRDNGAGFDNTYAHKLFQVFQRLHGDTEFEGTGIGLATVSRIVQRHHGAVCAEGEPGKGATFYFTLPQRTETRDNATNTEPKVHAP